MLEKCLLSIYSAKDRSCILAVLNARKVLLFCQDISLADLEHGIAEMLSKYKISAVILNQPKEEIKKLLLKLDLKVNLIFLNIKIGLLEIKQRYFAENKSREGFLSSLIPTPLKRLPPLAAEKYTAVMAAEKFIS